MSSARQDGKRVVIVTGASQGIGRAAALAFARASFRVAVVDIDKEEGKRTVGMVEKEGGEAKFIHTDVSDAGAVEAMVEAAVDTYGRIDCALNNAGIEGQKAPTAECTLENWERVIAINLTGLWLCMKYEILKMLETGGGSIVNMASVAGVVGFQNVPAYAAAKHGVNGLTKAAALEYAAKGIRINSVCPGIINTAMIERFTEGNEDALAQLTAGEPIGRLGDPEEVANAVVWLCSDGASFVTGHPLVVDGGFVAQ